MNIRSTVMMSLILLKVRAVHRGSNLLIFDGPMKNEGPREGPRKLQRGSQMSAECKNVDKGEKKEKIE